MVPDPDARRCSSAFDLVCSRYAACRNGGARLPADPAGACWPRCARTPGAASRTTPTGRRARVTVNGATLVSVAFGATYGPAFYREMTAAMRSGLRGDRAPLLRLVAEAIGGGTDAGDPVEYSEGLDAAVACHDYPQLYDMKAAPTVRRKQYAAALAATDPHPSGHLRAVHDPRVRPLRLAVARLVHRLAVRAGRATRPARRRHPRAATRRCPCWCSAVRWTASPRRPRAR